MNRVVRQYVGADCSVTQGSVWLAVRPDGVVLPEHGWKLHVSSRAADFPDLVERLIPLLAAEGCSFKLACSQRALHALNDGHTAPASVGKAFTIYPDPRRVREFGLRLAEELQGHQGPRILSDRRVLAKAPVYYRYGSFIARRGSHASGAPATKIIGPAGEEFDTLAGLSYQQPSWVEDPFSDVGADAERDRDGTLLDGRYRLVVGIREAAQGNTYRAIDERQDGRRVVVKQARALVAEAAGHNDSRVRLRNERRVLGVLDGVAGVPRFIDHFQYGDDEFLITSDCGPLTLAEDVRRNGPYVPGSGEQGRSLDRLAKELARILIAVHERGVVMRDLSSTNVLIGDGGGASIIDFGLSFHEGLHLPGWTPGYAPARQRHDEPPRDTDDLFALGMTLLFAASNLQPISVGDDPELPRMRALQTISRYHAPSETMSAIADLLGDEEQARAAVRRLASGGNGRPALLSLPSAPVVTAELAAEVTDNLVGDLLGQLDKVLEAAKDTQAAHDVSVYTGSAGIGLELLRHRERPAVEPTVRELAAFTARVASRMSLRPALFSGVTGVDMFLTEAVESGMSVAGWHGRSLPPPEWSGETFDLNDGTAGVGMGHLYFHRVHGDPADLEVARSCARAVLSQQPLGPLPLPGEADVTAGRAHGLAGVVELLVSLAGETGDAWAREAAADRVRALAERTRNLIDQAKDPSAEPLIVSWCRGLPGLGQTLLHAGTVLDDESLVDLAREAADACVARIPLLSSLGQCCGAAGVGDYLLNLAAVEQSERYRDAAFDLATHVLLRSGGPLSHPRWFAPTDTPDRSLSWAKGLAGILAFFRRLSDGGPGCLPVFRY
ncbi:lanthionine synthetase LanC family protein [Streptomyces sp. NPDC048717]|uniref:class III lanthionine synthetase LanKC N-terminal domain-containing protein n=1 Tax=Streptomyces sp. NPDC048717 TaxID=3154928 RepID=UPI0034462147